MLLWCKGLEGVAFELGVKGIGFELELPYLGLYFFSSAQVERLGA